MDYVSGGVIIIKQKKFLKGLITNKKTELLQENNRLKENMKYSQKVVSTGSWTHDIIHDEIFLSDEVYQILECSCQEFDGDLQSFYSYVHPDDLSDVKKVMVGALSGKEYDVEYRIVTPKGDIKFVHETTTAIRNEEMEPIKMVGVIRDITKQKLLEHRLRELGTNLNEAQRVSGVGSWKYDIINDKFFGSDELYRIYNINPSEHINDFENTLQLIHPEDRDKIRETRKLHYRGKSKEEVLRIPQQDGTDRYVQGKGEPIFNDKGQVVAIQGTIQDITEIELLKMKLEKSYKLIAQTEILAHVGSWEMDLSNNIINWSDEIYKIFGITPEEYSNTYEGFLKFVHPEDIRMIEFAAKNPVTMPFDMEYRIIRPDGLVREVYQKVNFKFDKQGNPIYVYGTIQDITDKKRLEIEIRKKQEELINIQRRFQILVEKSNDLFIIVSLDGTMTYVSEACEKVVGYKAEEMLGNNLYHYFAQEYENKLHQLVEDIVGNPKKVVQEIVLMDLSSHKSIHLEVSLQNFLSEPTIDGIVIHLRDVTKKMKMLERIAYINNHDETTGLPNRIHLNKILAELCKQKKKEQSKFALMMIDLEGLKEINYTFGYDIGNNLVKKIAKRIKKHLNNGYISRYSDDHMAIVIQDHMSYGKYEDIVKAILGLLTNSFTIENYEFAVTMNIGICVYPVGAQDAKTMKKHARAALLRARKEGKNCYKFYSTDYDIQNYKEFIIRSDLYKSLIKDQLRINYQPMVDIKTNELLAAEVLIRWEHPDWGMVPPMEFISVAEETGFIIQIGDWLLNEVCKTYKTWLDHGYPTIKISINYSSIQFFENDFTDKIINVIRSYGLDPHFLIIEITESIVMKKVEKTIEDIKKLQSVGIQIALDDFGTGYSSLSYLKAFHIDILKIDGSFIKNVNSDLTSAVIIKGIVNMMRELKIKLVAEGIENWEQLSFLRNLNCHTGQGYLYSKPVFEEEFEKLLRKRRCKPGQANNLDVISQDERRKFFRINFNQLLQAYLTIKEIKGKKLDIGNTKVLIQDLGPGGLCFISNVKFPIQKYIVLKFNMQLLGREITINGVPVWSDEYDYNLYQYGIEFVVDEKERQYLIRFLNQLQIKMRNNILFDEGDFITEHPVAYFNGLG